MITNVKTRFFVLLIFAISGERIDAQVKGTVISSLEKEFKNPPVSARPKALWPWVNGNVSLSQITFEMEDAKRKGMGGFDIWDIGTNIIEVVNTPNNALIGDAKFSTGNRKMRSNIIKLPNAWNKPFAEAPLLDAGLLGPITIQYASLLTSLVIPR